MEDRRKEAIKRRQMIKKRRRQTQLAVRIVLLVVSVIVLVGIILKSSSCTQDKTQGVGSLLLGIQRIGTIAWEKHPEWTEDFLTPNPYSRPGDPLRTVNNIFVHYVANPGTTAKQNRDYFEQLGETGERSASAHFIIDCDGEIIQCVPLDEIAYAVKSRNEDSISIECCHPTEDGAFTQETYDSLLELLRWLLEVYDLEKDDVLRHYDSNGKLCPLYYVENEDAWEQLKADI